MSIITRKSQDRKMKKLRLDRSQKMKMLCERIQELELLKARQEM